MLRVFVLLLGLLLTFCVYSETTALYAFNDSQKEQQFNGLIKELRCLVCQNQDLNDSNAKLAVELKNLVYEKISHSESNADIKSYLIERYGDFVTFAPPLTQKTYLLWGMPLLMIIIGLMIASLIIRRARV